MIWLALPGLGLPPSDLDLVCAEIPSFIEIRVLDQWRIPLESSPERLWTALGRPASGYGLIGHSIGGLSALHWAIERPGEVAELILLDPTVPEPGGPSWVETRIVDHLVKTMVMSTRGIARLAPNSKARLLEFVGRDPRTSRYRIEMIRRYCSQGGAERIWEAFSSSWAFSRMVERKMKRLGDDPLRERGCGNERLRPMQLVGLRNAGGDFLGSQRRLSHRIRSRLAGESASGHHLTRTVPKRIAAMIAAASGHHGD